MILYRKISEKSRGVVNICIECRKNPCDPRCPNAPEPPVVFVCTSCHAEIREGDTFYRLDGCPYCEECVEDGREEAEFHYGLE